MQLSVVLGSMSLTNVFMGLCQQWPLSPSILLDSWSFTMQRWWNLGAKMYQLSSGDLQIMAVCWKRYCNDKLKCGRGRQFSSSFHRAVCEDLLTASFWITNNRLLMCSMWFARLVLYITCDHPCWVLFLYCTHSSSILFCN